eukprot:8139-Heterococcus_DN1.PRE.8
MLASYKEVTDVPINKWKIKDKKYKQLRNLVILTSTADFAVQQLEKALAGSFNTFSRPISVQVGEEEYRLWDASAIEGTPCGSVVVEAINACGGEEVLGIAKWGSADIDFRALLNKVRQVSSLRFCCFCPHHAWYNTSLFLFLLVRVIVTLPYQQQEQEQQQEQQQDQEQQDGEKRTSSNNTSSGGAVKRKQISDGSIRTKRQHKSSAGAAPAAGSEAGRNCGSSSSQEQLNAAGTTGAASVPRTYDTGKDKKVEADDIGSVTNHRTNNSKRTSSDSTGSTVTKRQRQSATECSGDSSSGNKRGSARGKGKAQKLAALESDISGDEPDGAQDEMTSEQALQREIDQLRKQNAELTEVVDATSVQLRTSLAHCNPVLPAELQDLRQDQDVQVLAASVAKAVNLLRQLYQQKDATSGDAVAAHDEQVQLADDQQDEVTPPYS